MLFLKGQRCRFFIDDVLCRQRQKRTAGRDRIEVFALFCDVIGHILIGKALLVLRHSQQKLRLHDRTEFLTVVDDITEVFVLDYAHILFVQLGMGIKLFILAIGADPAAHEGEQKH